MIEIVLVFLYFYLPWSAASLQEAKEVTELSHAGLPATQMQITIRSPRSIEQIHVGLQQHHEVSMQRCQHKTPQLKILSLTYLDSPSRTSPSSSDHRERSRWL